MIGKETLVGNVFRNIKDHSRAFGVAGAVIGALLVIFYCGSIKHYPTGLTLADALFFLWVVVVFGFYYSVISLSFFVASLFWVTAFAKPINFFLKRVWPEQKLLVPLPKTDWILVIAAGLVANTFIFLFAYLKGHSLFVITISLLFVGFFYTLIENVAKAFAGETSDLVDHSGKPWKRRAVGAKSVQYLFYGFIYAAPLLVAQVGGGVTRTTFETMGVRQSKVDVYLLSEGYKEMLSNLHSQGLLGSYSCETLCRIANVDVLFTSIGTNTKLKLTGKEGAAEVVIPSDRIVGFIKEYTGKSMPLTGRMPDQH